MQSILADLISRVEADVRQKPRGQFVRLNPPVSGSSEALLRAVVGELPEALIELLRIHDGESGTSGLLGTGVRLLSSAEITEAVAASKPLLDSPDRARTSGPVGPWLWHERWYPFLQTDDAVGIVDLAPVSGGNIGQIALTDCVNLYNRVVASSMVDFFNQLSTGALRIG